MDKLMELIISRSPLPWKIEPRRSKYYGTHILDSRGCQVIEIWNHETCNEPSEREKEYFGNWTQEAWNEYVCDTHWECKDDYELALAIVEFANHYASTVA